MGAELLRCQRTAGTRCIKCCAKTYAYSAETKCGVVAHAPFIKILKLIFHSIPLLLDGAQVPDTMFERKHCS